MSAGSGDEVARARIRSILRKAALYAWGFFGAALATVLGGAALMAWVLTKAGLPFLESWLVMATLVLLPSLIGIAWRAARPAAGGRETVGTAGNGAPEQRNESN